MIHKNLIFRFDPTMSIADKIAEEDDTSTDIGDDLEPSTNKELSTSPRGWNEILLDLEADNTEG
jgi:hypothetical protein